MDTMSARVGHCVQAIRAQAPGVAPVLGFVLGSGLGDFADQVASPTAIDYAALPHFPTTGVEGHRGRLVLGTLEGRPVAVMQGRVHYYEGYSAEDVTFPLRVLIALGVRAVVVTNAAGGIRAGFSVGDLMNIEDHINLTGNNPLMGKNDAALGPRFPDMTAAYHPELRRQLAEAARAEGIALHSGVYAGLAGPSYETPAEIRMLRTLGADAVGMSTVFEVIAAAHAKLPLVGISCITNLAAGLGEGPLSHAEVADAADRARTTFARLLLRFTQGLRLP